MITLAILTLIYFLPTVIASQRGHSIGGILVLNFFIGWTIVGWFVMLLWALISSPPWRCIPLPIFYPQYYDGRGY